MALLETTQINEKLAERIKWGGEIYKQPI